MPSFLDAAQTKDLAALLDTIALDEFAGGRDAAAAMYHVWLTYTSDLSWEIVSIQPRLVGGQVVVVDVDAQSDGLDGPFTLVISTNREGRIVSWYTEKQQPTEVPWSEDP